MTNAFVVLWLANNSYGNLRVRQLLLQRLAQAHQIADKSLRILIRGEFEQQGIVTGRDAHIGHLILKQHMREE